MSIFLHNLVRDLIWGLGCLALCGIGAWVVYLMFEFQDDCDALAESSHVSHRYHGGIIRGAYDRQEAQEDPQSLPIRTGKVPPGGSSASCLGGDRARVLEFHGTSIHPQTKKSLGS